MATPAATALSVRATVAGVRALGFRGSSPHLWRDVGDETLHLVHVQRSIAGVTGRDPGYTINLSVVHGALRRAQRAAGVRDSGNPPRVDGGHAVWERVGQLAFGHDHWWHPSDDAGAHDDANSALRTLQDVGLPWLDSWIDPAVAVDRLLSGRVGIPEFELAGALLVERPGDSRRAVVAEVLTAWVEQGRTSVERRIDVSEAVVFRQSLVDQLSSS